MAALRPEQHTTPSVTPPSQGSERGGERPEQAVTCAAASEDSEAVGVERREGQGEGLEPSGKGMGGGGLGRRGFGVGREAADLDLTLFGDAPPSARQHADNAETCVDGAGDHAGLEAEAWI
jgi:hypothetical protein